MNFLRKKTTGATLITLLFLWLVLPGQSNEAPELKPNIIILVADDLGWADVGYHGSKIKTPNIDRLREQGVELNHHYVAPMCTPTRAALLTGRYWSRFGNTKPSNERVLPWNVLTLSKALQDTGYVTAITGKWHLGSKPEWGPRKFGFDQSYGSLAGGINPWNHLYKHGPYSRTWHRNDQLIEEEGHVTDLITQEAIRFIKEQRKGPFFLYVPFTAVHTPFDEPKQWLITAENIEPERRQYVACAQHMDNAIGRILDTLIHAKLLEKTLIIFFSDNGGTNGDDSSRYPNTKPNGKIKGLNTPLRGWKAQTYEGGIRVPAIAAWSGHLKPQKMKTPVHVVDWMPTISELVGCKVEKDPQWDGMNIWPLLNGKQIPQKEERVLYCKGVNGDASALHKWPWKLILRKEKGKNQKELFNLELDSEEKNNLAQKYPEMAKRLSEILHDQESRDNDSRP